ncbi:DNA-binding protein SMUBP-2 [Verticillium alfalfae VaMs.102]|uniref:DNA helicase n=1 Tax=Verticillium alfalfae (strain VaMs.102 / ATCC MYA-4576 / FGSC 10136) TaxID=526221 RepID=C9SHZ6_VERA1|nr:DNA-binding protein SMUBP-2 [Verticillium alfalfae VaMs.102]EEY18569.1 DNA-binding protein SMUBP-2 [Verticillium alfalfae VaMs.102]
MAPKGEPPSIPLFASTQLALLSNELAADLAQTSTLLASHAPATLQRAGLALTSLLPQARRTGPGARTLLELAPDPATATTQDLPEHGLRPGDIVLVAEQPAGAAQEEGAQGARGQGRQGRRGEGAEGLADEVTYKRMNQTMEKLQKMPEAEYSSFMRVLFGLSSPSPTPVDLAADGDFGKLEWVDPSLNDSQKDAIRFALASREVALIHGPPGLILQFVRRDQRILVCGPSNISVDNIVERLAPHKIPIVRLGHPARLLPSVLAHSLDVLTHTSSAGAIVQDVRAEMDAKQAALKKARTGRDRRAIYADLKDLRKEYRERERGCLRQLVGGSKVVLATLHGAGGFQLRDEKFDVVIIDEASQALEAQCWVPLLRANKVVCAGDHLQLPPTIKSLNSKTNMAKKQDEEEVPTVKGMTLETTLFDRLLSLHGPSIKRMLTTQYRMHEAIMQTVKRGSAFLRRWIEFLEENADLRYPDVLVLQEA